MLFGVRGSGPGYADTVDFSSEIVTSLSFTAESAEHAETSQNPAKIENYLKTLAPAALLRGDKTLWFLDGVGSAANTACPGRQPQDQYPYVA